MLVSPSVFLERNAATNTCFFFTDILDDDGVLLKPAIDSSSIRLVVLGISA